MKFNFKKLKGENNLICLNKNSNLNREARLSSLCDKWNNLQRKQLSELEINF